MKIVEIESLPEVRKAARVLRELEKRGLGEPCIASGWTRGFLTDIPPSDIDIAYVGPLPHEEARQNLADALQKLHVSGDWDIEGIWNAQAAYGVTHTAHNYLLYYVDSIDSVFLAADGKLHDPTGYGFADAQSRTLRLNTYDSSNGRTPPPKENVYICLEGCRRIAKFGWTPTAESVERITKGAAQWQLLTAAEQTYYVTKKIAGKYQTAEYASMRAIYDKYGWGFVFDLAKVRKGTSPDKKS
jgi:hypothetical protein